MGYRRSLGAVIIVAIAATAAFAVGSFVSAPAQAKGVDLECQGYSTSAYRPGVTLEERKVTVTQDGLAGPCLGMGNPKITSGTWHLKASGVLSCSTGSARGVRTYTWNNGAKSVESVTLTIDARPGGETVLITQGEIVRGVFKGDKTRTVAVLATTDLTACLRDEGLQTTAGPRQIVFVSS
jgi:hypothetical protein